MPKDIFHNKSKTIPSARTRMRGGARRLGLPLLGVLSGLFNGFMGTGGGMVLSVGLRTAYPGQDRENLSIATASMMVLSFSSTILYSIGGYIETKDVLPVVFPALLGGALGSLMLGRIRHELIELLLGGMLLYSGLSLLL